MNKASRIGTAWLLCGVTASGKTTFAKSMAEKGALHLSVDKEIWNQYGREFLNFDSATKKRITLEAEDKLKSVMNEKLRLGYDVVIDSCLCKRFKRDAFRQTAESCNAKCKLIYFTAPKDVLVSRLKKRCGNSYDDIIISDEELQRFLSGFEPPQHDEEYEIIQ